MGTRGATWTWLSDFDMWELAVSAETEARAAELHLGSWAQGRYDGPPADQPYRS